jgi:phage major head subunit gpT-like protein
MAFTEAQNLAIVRTELDTVFFQNFDYDGTDPGIVTATTGKLFRPIPIDRLAHIGEVSKATGLWSSIGETQTVPTQTPQVTNKYIINNLDFAQGIELSKNMFDDNMHGVWSENVRQFALMARVSQDNNSFKVFRNAFTTQLTADGSAWIGSHTTISGVPVSNILASSPLNTTTLNNAFVALRQQKNQAGVILGGVPAYLVVPPKLLKLATEITDSVLISDSANNAVNFYRSMLGIEVMSSPYLSSDAGGSDTAWYLLSKNHSVSRLIRQGVQTALRNWDMSNNRTYFYQGNFREEVFVPDYAGAVGATGV